MILVTDEIIHWYLNFELLEGIEIFFFWKLTDRFSIGNVKPVNKKCKARSSSFSPTHYLTLYFLSSPAHTALASAIVSFP